MIGRLSEFGNFRSRMSARISKIDHLGIKRFFNLDTEVLGVSGSILILHVRHALASLDLYRQDLANG